MRDYDYIREKAAGIYLHVYNIDWFASRGRWTDHTERELSIFSSLYRLYTVYAPDVVIPADYYTKRRRRGVSEVVEEGGGGCSSTGERERKRIYRKSIGPRRYKKRDNSWFSCSSFREEEAFNKIVFRVMPIALHYREVCKVFNDLK